MGRWSGFMGSRQLSVLGAFVLAVPLLSFLACGYRAPSEATGEASEMLSTSALAPRPLLITQVPAGNVASNPAFFQTRAGTLGDFALVVPDSNGGLLSYTRANDLPGVPWHGPIRVFDDSGVLDAIAAIQSNYESPGDLQIVGRQGSQLVFAWRDNDAVIPWHGVYPIAVGTTVAGTPSMIQSTFGVRGNFEVVTPRAAGGLAHLWRDNDHGMAWNGPVTFGDTTAYAGTSLLQTNYGSPGDLALAAVSTSGLLHFYTRGSSPVASWSPPVTIGSRAAGAPVLFQSKFGARGNYEIFVPSADTGVDEYWRDNDSGPTWHRAGSVLASLGHVDSISVFEGTYGQPGNFELVARVGASLFESWRVGLGSFADPVLIVDAVDAPTPAPAALTYGYSEYLGPLTAAPSNGEAAVDLFGTDLGTSFEAADGSLAFLFGDSWTMRSDLNNDDSVAFTTSTSVARYQPPRLSWVGGATQFTPFDPPSIVGLGMDVPVEGLALGGLNYYFFDRGWHYLCPSPVPDGCLGAHTGSILASMNGRDSSTFTVLHDVESARFVNVSAVPGSDGYVYLYGDGMYRQSAVYLARIPATAAALADTSQWTYLRGLRHGVPVWGPDELTAVPLFRAGVPAGAPAPEPPIDRPDHGIGELSVRKHPTLPLYLMTYQAWKDVPSPGGVALRTSATPWGPWSAPTLILQGSEAYGTFVHLESDKAGEIDDGLGSDCRVPGAPGGLVPSPSCPAHGQITGGGGMYGPYLIPRYFTDAGNVHEIVYTMSSWNPYQTHLVRTYLTSDGTVLRRPRLGGGATSSLANASFALGTTGWYGTGDPFTIYSAGGRNWLNTFTAKGDAAEGTLSQWFVVDGTVNALHFFVHGGHGAVKLLRGGDVVRTTRGRHDNGTNIEVCWGLRDFRSEPLQVQIEDVSAEPWGFVTVSGMDLVYPGQPNDPCTAVPDLP